MVLVNVSRAQIYFTHRAAQSIPGRWIGGALSIGGLSGYNTESLTMAHSG